MHAIGVRRLPDKAIEIARQLCAGLHAVHQAGVLHRDLKPANVIIDGRGRARITDFGIADLESELKGGAHLAAILWLNLSGRVAPNNV